MTRMTYAVEFVPSSHAFDIISATAELATGPYRDIWASQYYIYTTEILHLSVPQYT